MKEKPQDCSECVGIVDVRQFGPEPNRELDKKPKQAGPIHRSVLSSQLHHGSQRPWAGAVLAASKIIPTAIRNTHSLECMGDRIVTKRLYDVNESFHIGYSA